MFYPENSWKDHCILTQPHIHTCMCIYLYPHSRVSGNSGSMSNSSLTLRQGCTGVPARMLAHCWRLGTREGACVREKASAEQTQGWHVVLQGFKIPWLLQKNLRKVIEINIEWRIGNLAQALLSSQTLVIIGELPSHGWSLFSRQHFRVTHGRGEVARAMGVQDCTPSVKWTEGSSYSGRWQGNLKTYTENSKWCWQRNEMNGLHC